MKNQKILGVIVTYNPIIIDLKINIESIYNQIDHLVVIDNNSNNCEEIKDLCQTLEVETILNGINYGLGYCYNQLLDHAIDNFEYFITLDQDTFLEKDTIKGLLEEFKTTKIAAVGPNWENKHESKTKEVTTLIQSSCIFRTDILKKVGLFNESYFIDSVDFEYCLRIRQQGYILLKSGKIVVKHQLGIKKSSRLIGDYSSHNENRYFYIARNHKRLSKTFFREFPLFILKKNIFFLFEIVKILIIEKNKKKLLNIVKGLRN